MALKKFEEFLNEGNRNTEKPEKGEGYRVWNNNEPLKAAVEDKKNAVFFYNSNTMVCNIISYDEISEFKGGMRFESDDEKEKKQFDEITEKVEKLEVGESTLFKEGSDYIVLTKIKAEK